MSDNTKQEGLDDMVRSFKEYSRGNGRYDELDFKEDVLNLINFQVLEAIEKIKNQTGIAFIAPTHGVTLSAIEAIEKEYRNE